MKTTEESILNAMDSTDKEILPFLPYILQDFWEIGSDPELIINLLKKHSATDRLPGVLDLGCGKGAVSIKIAKQLKYPCHGIDAMPEFISFAKEKAKEYGVGKLCKFEVADIREKVKDLGKYDIIILGSIGQVFGTYYETLTKLKKNLSDGGIIIIDDGYIEDDSSFTHEQVFPKKELKKQIAEAGMELIDEIIFDEDPEATESYDQEFENLSKRCQELIEKYPDKADIFRNYRSNQQKEYENLKNEITCSTMVVQKQ